MSDRFRFDGRVAVVTGGGSNPGLGRAHALLLAARGASVVVNDIGRDPDLADIVAVEIRAAGGTAIANHADVASAQGAAALIAAAVDTFGRVDILVNNAAISVAAPFEVMTARDFERHIDVNLMGTYHCCHAVWPHMMAQGHGRIVNTTSAAMTGFSGQAAYATSKGGVWSLTRALAAEGQQHGIAVNAISPGAYTRLVQSMMFEDSPLLRHSRENLPAELCAPALAWLCHDDCPLTGECIDVVGGHVQRTFMGRTTGMQFENPSIENIADNWGAIAATGGFEIAGIGGHDTAEWKLRPYKAEIPDA